MALPSPADFARMDPAPSRLYPTLEELEDMQTKESNPLGALGSQKKMRPQRPPPPRSQSLPTQDLATLAILPPLFPHEIRWFYKEAQKPWQPFNGYDSLALEERYRSLQVSGEGDLDVSVLGDLHEVNVLERQCKPIYWTAKEPWKVLRGSWFEVSGDKWSPLQEEECARIEEEHCSRRWRERAKADADLQTWAEAGALRTDGARQQPEPAGKPQTQPIVVLNRIAEEKHEVIWLGDSEIYKIKKELTVHFVKKVGEKLGGKGQLYGALKLSRGYRDPASREDKEPPIGHLIFIVHGIGQNMSASCIARSTSDFRETCSQVAHKHFPDHWREKRVEFLPVEWRTWLSLDKGLLSTITPHGIRMLRSLLNDSIVDVMYYMSPRFGPEILDGLRFALHKQFAEFTHRNPSFLANGGTVSLMAHSLGSVMTYDLLHETCSAQGIKHEDPSEDTLGPQSTLLGFNPSSSSSSARGAQTVPSGLESGPPWAVEMKDMRAVKFTSKLQSPDPDSLYSPAEDEPAAKEDTDYGEAWLELEQLHKRVAELESQLGIATREGGTRKPQGLNFKVEHFFAVGSPLGLFILMREHDSLVKKSHRSTASLIPTSICNRIHNLHHPSDPIAYRIEPLINPHYAQIKPVKVDSANSKRPSVEAVGHAAGIRDLQSPEEKSLVSPQTKSWFSSLLGSVAAVASGSSKKVASEESIKPKDLDKAMDNDNSLRPEEKLKERLDFMLRESFAESSYLNALTAHTSYWSSQDCALYVLLQIYKYRM